MNVKTTKTVAKLIALSLIASTMLEATNGDTLIAVGAKSRGMGGTGIALSHGAESSLSNPALITSVEGTEISFGGTLFMPDITTGFTGSSMLGPMAPYFDQEMLSSEADTNMIPSVSIAHKINENWYVGIGMFGTAGMGTDYRNATMAVFPPSMQIPPVYGNFNMISNLQLMQFAVPIAYKTGGLSVAVTPILQYGNLDMNYQLPTATGIANVGNGLAQDFGFGYNLGLAYDFTEDGVEGLTVGAVYKSSIEMTYDGQISDSASNFGLIMSDVLEQPAEIGVGISYVTGQHTFAFDYKQIQWSDAEGYGDVSWEDQDIFAVGYQYTQDNWALRAGYNYGSSAVVEQDTNFSNGMQAAAKASAENFFNLLGFPATAEQHYTVGATYVFSDQFSLDLAYVYSPTNTETFDLGVFADPTQGMALQSIITEHQEDSVSFQLSYKF